MVGYLIALCAVSAIVGIVAWLNLLPEPAVENEREKDAFIQRW